MSVWKLRLGVAGEAEEAEAEGGEGAGGDAGVGWQQDPERVVHEPHTTCVRLAGSAARRYVCVQRLRRPIPFVPTKRRLSPWNGAHGSLGSQRSIPCSPTELTTELQPTFP